MAEQEKKFRVRVKIKGRPIEGAEVQDDGRRPAHVGWGCGGVYWPVGESEGEVTQAGLDELRAAEKDVDSQGRPQINPLMSVTELGLVESSTGRDPSVAAGDTHAPPVLQSPPPPGEKADKASDKAEATSYPKKK